MRVALITGASGGLGERLSIGLDGAGYRVVVHYFRAVDRAERLRGVLKNDPCLLKADLGDFEETRRMAEELDSRIGRLHLIVNNAGVTEDGLLLRYPESAWDRVLRTNLKGVFNTLKNFVPIMVRSGGGHIINISSYAGLRGKEGQVAYSASKAAILGLTRSLARELARYGIRVNAVIPGYLPLGMGAGSERAMERARGMSILDGLSEPGDVVDLVTCLAGTRSVTGQVFTLESRI